MKKEAANTFADGLNMDLSPLVTPNTVLTDNINGTFITFNGDELSLQNDSGNTYVSALLVNRKWRSGKSYNENHIVYTEDGKHYKSNKNDNTSDLETSDWDEIIIFPKGFIAYNSETKSHFRSLKDNNEDLFSNDSSWEELKVTLKDGYWPIGVKEHAGVLYIVSTNGDNVEFGSYPSPVEVTEESFTDERVKIDEFDIGNLIVVNEVSFSPGTHIIFRNINGEDIDVTHLSTKEYSLNDGEYKFIKNINKFYRLRVFHKLRVGNVELTDDIWNEYIKYKASLDNPPSTLKTHWINEDNFKYYCRSRYKGKLQFVLDIEDIYFKVINISKGFTVEDNDYSFSFNMERRVDNDNAIQVVGAFIIISNPGKADVEKRRMFTSNYTSENVTIHTDLFSREDIVKIKIIPIISYLDHYAASEEAVWDLSEAAVWDLPEKLRRDLIYYHTIPVKDVGIPELRYDLKVDWDVKYSPIQDSWVVYAERFIKILSYKNVNLNSHLLFSTWELVVEDNVGKVYLNWDKIGKFTIARKAGSNELILDDIIWNKDPQNAIKNKITSLIQSSLITDVVLDNSEEDDIIRLSNSNEDPLNQSLIPIITDNSSFPKEEYQAIIVENNEDQFVEPVNVTGYCIATFTTTLENQGEGEEDPKKIIDKIYWRPDTADWIKEALESMVKDWYKGEWVIPDPVNNEDTVIRIVDGDNNGTTISKEHKNLFNIYKGTLKITDNLSWELNDEKDVLRIPKTKDFDSVRHAYSPILFIKDGVYEYNYLVTYPIEATVQETRGGYLYNFIINIPIIKDEDNFEITSFDLEIFYSDGSPVGSLIFTYDDNKYTAKLTLDILSDLYAKYLISGEEVDWDWEADNNSSYYNEEISRGYIKINNVIINRNIYPIDITNPGGFDDPLPFNPFDPRIPDPDFPDPLPF